jgi:hypothetical protein
MPPACSTIPRRLLPRSHRRDAWSCRGRHSVVRATYSTMNGDMIAILCDRTPGAAGFVRTIGDEVAIAKLVDTALNVLLHCPKLCATSRVSCLRHFKNRRLWRRTTGMRPLPSSHGYARAEEKRWASNVWRKERKTSLRYLARERPSHDILNRSFVFIDEGVLQ